MTNMATRILGGGVGDVYCAGCADQVVEEREDPVLEVEAMTREEYLEEMELVDWETNPYHCDVCNTELVFLGEEI